MLNNPHSSTITISTQIAGMIAALLTFLTTSILLAGLYFTTPLFGLLATSTLTLALGGTGIGLLVIGLSIAAYFIAQAIFGSDTTKNEKAIAVGADDVPPFTPSSNPHLKKSSGLDKGAVKANSFDDQGKSATGSVKKTESGSRLFQTKAQANEAVILGSGSGGYVAVIRAAYSTPTRPFNREKSEVYQAAWHEDETKYNAVIEEARKTEAELKKYAKVDKLQYLVITGFANKDSSKAKEHLQAETFIREHIEKLGTAHLKLASEIIFRAGNMGPSALQLAAAELDIHMVLALLLPFTNNPDEVRADQQKIADRNDLTPQEQWQQRTSILLKALPENIRKTALEQLKTVKEKNWMVKGEAIKKAYEDCIAKITNALLLGGYNALLLGGYDYKVRIVKDAWKLADIAWRFIGECQTKLSRALLLDCYFNPQRSNKVCPHFYEAQLPRVFKFWNDDLLFPDLIKKLGRGIDSAEGFGIYRSWLGEVWAAWAGGWRDGGGLGVEDLNAVTHAFEVKPAQLDWIIDQLTLSLDSTETPAVITSLSHGGGGG